MEKFKELIAKFLTLTPLNLTGMKIQKNLNAFRVVIYHTIKSPDEFKKQLNQIEDSGFEFVKPDYLLNPTKDCHKIPVILTFDDCFKDQFENAIPVLEEKNIKAIFFASPSLIGKDNYMTWNEIQEISTLGHWIGSHSLSHKRYSTMSLMEIRKDLAESKRKIEDITGEKVMCFAFPFGRRTDFNDFAVDEAHSAGYRFVFSAVRGWNRGDEKAFYRDALDPGWDKNLCLFFLSGAYQFFNIPYFKLKKFIRYFLPLGYEYSYFDRWNFVEKLLIRSFGLIDLPARTRFNFACKIFQKLGVRKAVDLGTATGLFPEFLVRKGVFERVLGIDINEEWLKEARKAACITENGGVLFEKCNLNEGFHVDIDADVIFSIESLQYLTHPEYSLKNVMSHLKSGGYLFLHFHELDFRHSDKFRQNDMKGEDVIRFLRKNNFSILRSGRGPSTAHFFLNRIFNLLLRTRILLIFYPLLLIASKLIPYESKSGEYFYVLARKN